MLYTCSISKIKNFDIEKKYFIVINPKNVKIKGLVHRPELAPKRELYQWAMEHKDEPDWFQYYSKVFKEDMVSRAGLVNALNQIEKQAKTEDVLLVCFCPDPNFCHRGLIADEMAKRGIEVIKE